MKKAGSLGRFGRGPIWSVVGLLVLLMTSSLSAQPKPEPPRLGPASDEAEVALRTFLLHAPLRATLWAAEPDLANPVAIHVDHLGRVMVCESFRQGRGVEDNRNHMNWLNDDLAAQTVDDRLAYMRKFFPDSERRFTRYDDRLKLLIDSDGDGQADQTRVFADHFNQVEAGTGAGAWQRGNEVLYTCIPHVWRLVDEDGDGVADQRTPLFSGFGVRFAFRGHDLHGICLGPDGRLYFSIGDRGYHVATERARQALPGGGLELSASATFANPESGAVFRCELDGTGLEVVATGLRNPQELAFDDVGNLFTGDNNSDSGDLARWVTIVDGSDSGWRMAYQYLADRGPFNREQLWHPFHANQPAYIVPPIANVADGPAGLCYYPGTGWSPQYQNCFFLCDFRGSPSNSGIRTLRVEPRGAFFELVRNDKTIWRMLATDAHFGPDGALYVTDWVNGWNGEGKGRIYRVVDPGASTSLVQQVQQLLSEGLDQTSLGRLREYLAHDDQRVRLETQLQLVARGTPAAREVLTTALASETSRPARLHAVWGIGTLLRRSADSNLAAALIAATQADDREVRSQAARMIGDANLKAGIAALLRLTRDESTRVRYFAANALARLAICLDPAQKLAARQQMVVLLRENADRDPVLRHGAVMGLSQLAEAVDLRTLADDESVAVRLGAVVALRRQASTEVARFLQDIDYRVRDEAARAIYDVPIAGALPALAQRLTATGTRSLVERSLAANERMGGAEAAQRLARFAADARADRPLRKTAIQMLTQWAQPPERDRILGMWRPLPSRDAAVATAAYRQHLPGMLSGDEEVRVAAAEGAAILKLREVVPTLRELVNQRGGAAEARANALLALESLDSEAAAPLAQAMLADASPFLRAAARRVLAARRPRQTLALLLDAVDHGQTHERQDALRVLADLPLGVVDESLAGWLEQWHGFPADAQLELLQATRARQSQPLRQWLATFDAERNQWPQHLRFAEALSGGNAQRGAQVFSQRSEASCVRCHKIGDNGGEVGPELTKIATEKDRQYLLEAIVDPNRAIAKGFETVMVADIDGQIHAGIVKFEDDDHLRLMTAEGTTVSLKKEDIEQRRAGKSSMPEDMAKQLTREDIRDLVEYLSTLK